jgi:hypothetical protein
LPSDAITKPIFIVGSPRSGTTLMCKVLDRHPALAICGETHFHQLVYRRRKAFGDLANPAKRRYLIEQYLESRPIKKLRMNTPALVEKLSREAVSYQAMFTSMLRYYAESQGKPRMGEKTPRHALFLPALCEWFPDAIILHMVRDPRAAVASLQREPWASDSVVLNARRWVTMNTAARLFRDQPGYLEVRYENLVTDPEGELKKICHWIGEEYSPSVLTPEADRPAGGEQALSRRAITPARQELWRKELTPAQIAQIEWVAGENVELFGYRREAAPASAFTVARGYGYAAFEAVRFQATRLPALWYRYVDQTKLVKFEHWAGPRSWRKRGPSGEGV